jgi:hypothetical protein
MFDYFIGIGTLIEAPVGDLGTCLVEACVGFVDHMI